MLIQISEGLRSCRSDDIFALLLSSTIYATRWFFFLFIATKPRNYKQVVKGTKKKMKSSTLSLGNLHRLLCDCIDREPFGNDGRNEVFLAFSASFLDYGKVNFQILFRAFELLGRSSRFWTQRSKLTSRLMGTIRASVLKHCMSSSEHGAAPLD